jgi:DNA mismatch endonuclease (patch repair protein)
MADITTPEKRSRMMAGIRGKDTKPEMLMRRALFERGFRYRLHARGLPGTPDLVFRRHGAVIFVHGCFWHGHDCSFFRWPATRPEFWRKKIARNREVDGQSRERLLADGWRVLTVWECALRGRSDEQREAVYDATADWLRGSSRELHLDWELADRESRDD